MMSVATLVGFLRRARDNPDRFVGCLALSRPIPKDFLRRKRKEAFREVIRLDVVESITMAMSIS